MNKKYIIGYLVIIIQIIILFGWYYISFLSKVDFKTHVDDIMSFGLFHVVAFFNFIFLLIFWWKRKQLKGILIWKVIFLIAILCVLWLTIGWARILFGDL